MELERCKTCKHVRYKKKWISPEEFDLESQNKDLSNVEFDDIQCKRCTVISANYFEGTFQLRNTNSNMFNDAIEFMNDYMAIQEEKERGFIIKPMQNASGIDLLLSSRKVLAQLGKAVYQEFGGELKVSKKLFSRNQQTSKEVWRVTILVRLPDVNVKDVIIDEEKDEFLQVRRYSKDSIIVENLKTLKKRTIKGADAKKLKVETKFYKAMVSRYKPNIEIIEPFEFQSVNIQNQIKAKSLMEEGKQKKIRVFEYEDKWYCAD